MKYLSCTTQDQVSILDQAAPQPAAGEIIVRLSLCGVCGTDTLKVFGAYPKPQKLGHEVVGRVHALGPGVTRFAEGQRVALAHHAPDASSHYAKRGSETMDPQFKRSNIDPGGFAEFIRVPAELVGTTVLPVPDHVPDERAVFMEPLACCLRAVDRVPLRAGDTALIVGAGAVGMLFVPLLRDVGVATLVADVRPERISVAREWGAAGGGVPGQDDVASLCKTHSQQRGVDAVILCAVNAASIAMALACVRDGGSIIIFGGKPGSEAMLPMWDIWLREINLVSSYSATPGGLARALALLSTPAWAGIEKLISHRLPLAKGQEAFDLVHRGQASKVVIMA